MINRARSMSDSDCLYVTDIAITCGKSGKVSECLDVHLDDIPRTPLLDEKSDLHARWRWKGDGMEISPRSKLVVRPAIKRGFGILKSKGDALTIPIVELFESSGGVGRTEWKKTYEKFEISVGVCPSRPPQTPVSSHASIPTSTPSGSATSSDADLPSTTDELMRICPRFRVLVIGRTGVGKSSLINQAFGVSDASISKGKAGVHDINFEIESKDNPHFVVHDSQGLEPGETNNFNIATSFIERRKRMRDLKDKLHAIWLCIEIPCAGARLFETGDENFIKLDLGHVPVIVVFTKFDQLVDLEEMKLSAAECAELSEQQVKDLARKKAQAAFEVICLDTLRRVVPNNTPLWMKVSSETGYQNTLSELTQLTYDNVKKYVAEEASLVTAIAQRASPDTKIYASIAVGKSKYWEGLGCSTNFPGRTLRSCIDVLHKDIIAVWNFPDAKMHLASKEFKALMTHVVDDLAENDALDPNKSLVAGLSLIGTIAGVVGGLSGPAAPIVIPIVASFVFAKWIYDVYQQSHSVLRVLMGYIVDLTIIMQTVFLLTRGDPRPITRRVIKLATAAYMDSASRMRTHVAITEFVKGRHVFKRMDRDAVLSKIVELIEEGRSDEGEMERMKKEKLDSKLDDVLGAQVKDEPWDVVVDRK